MAPASSVLQPRQFGNNDGDRDNNNGPFGDGNGGVSKWAIIGIIIAVVVIGFVVFFLIFRRMRSRRQAVASAINLSSTTPYKPNTSIPTGQNGNSDPSKYSGGAGGYTATSDQNHSLLGHAEAPAIVTWDADHEASTQDGFGYDNNLHLAAPGIQRPASVASFSAPPPRYEEATNLSSSTPGSSAGRRPGFGQGEAASYFNSTVPMGEENRGRSRSADHTAGSENRGRALSVDARSVNGDRRRSISRFREEGMVDASVDKS
jgi:hypothetical protein